MNWIQCLSKALQYIEGHLTEEISMENVASEAYTSGAHFQLIFHLVMGMAVGEYIRNRRLNLAAQDLLRPDAKILDVALRYPPFCIGRGKCIEECVMNNRAPSHFCPIALPLSSSAPSEG